MKKNKYNKGDIVLCKAFVWAEYERDIFLPGFEIQNIEVIHIPALDRGTTRKLLVRQELPEIQSPFLVVGIKQIQTGYYYQGISPSNNWTGYDEGEPPRFEPDYYHNVYVLETLNTERWQSVGWSLESDLQLK